MGIERPPRWRAVWTAGALAGRRLTRRAVGGRDVELGARLTAQLDQMKGLPMKLGQIVSYMDVPLPEPVVSSLSRLQQGERGLDPVASRAAVESALGGSLESHFDSFELQPIAAASIGQVHRACARGEQLAVKVQYPGIAETFADDLGVVRRLASAASLATAVDGRAIVDELTRRLEEECDYGREARMQRCFARAFSTDAEVDVPRVIDRLSTPALLTSEWVDGCSFDQLRRNGDQGLIDNIAQILVRFSYRSLLNLALIQADPHPGNFLFRPDGRVSFLDFGCVRALEPEFVGQLRNNIVSLRDGDKSGFRRSVDALGLAGRRKRFDYDHFRAVMEHLYRPLLAPRFRFTSDYVREGHRYNGPSNPNARYLSIPSQYVWVMRLQWGLWSILARLNAEGRFRPILDQVLADDVSPARDGA